MIPTQPTLVYFADPMCSWCWGFSPQYEQLIKETGNRLRFELRMGGLRPGTKTPLTAREKAYLRHHWAEIHALTGQPFSDDILTKEDFVYDTFPAAHAVRIVGELAPQQQWPFFKSVQAAFYRDNQNLLDAAVYNALADKLNIDAASFKTRFQDPAAKKVTWEEFDAARELGVQAFPTLLLNLGERWRRISLGYSTAGQLVERLEKFL